MIPLIVRCALPALFAAAALAAPPERVRVLILTGETDLPYHDWRATTPFVKDLLERTGRFAVSVAEHPRGLDDAALAGYDALVLNYNGPRWGHVAERAVERFLASGKGMVAFHGVSYGSFFGMVFDKRWTLPPGGGDPWPAYADMLGASWKPENIGHAVRHVFTVKWVDRDHPISRGLEPEFIADDELYHRMELKPNAHVLAAAYSDTKQHGTGRDEPILWTVPFRGGRVVHLTLGHDVKAMSMPGFTAAFTRAVEWAGTGAVTLPATRSNSRPLDNRRGRK